MLTFISKTWIFLIFLQTVNLKCKIIIIFSSTITNFLASVKVLPTFGQPAVLGGMFTQYQDMFLPGLSLWKPKVTKNLTHI